MYELSINNKYHEIMTMIEQKPSNLEKAYYYSLIKRTDGLQKIMNKLKEQYTSFDYLQISNPKCYELAIYEFNNTCMRLLQNIVDDKDKEAGEKLKHLLSQAAARYSKAYNTIKDITNKDIDIQRMNEILLKHEEYYMKKDNQVKMSGTIYGDLFLIRQIAYDYYWFYKKNYLMMDWFSDVERMVTPYIKAVFCTYYPDEFQRNFQGKFLRTKVETYPIELLDVDMMVKHIKQKDLKSIALHYKVDSIDLSEGWDISVLFEDFCMSMKEYWNIWMIGQLETFSFLLSLCRLTTEQNTRIVKAFILLLTPSVEENINTIINNIYALSIYVKKHFDKNIGEYKDLLKLLINNNILLNLTTHKDAYPELIKTLSVLKDEELYNICCEEFDRIKDTTRRKMVWIYIYRNIFWEYDSNKWGNFIEENLNSSWNQEIFQFLYERKLLFDEKIKRYYIETFKAHTDNDRDICIYPDHKIEIIDDLIDLVLLGIVNENDIGFMKEYTYMNDYLKFIFEPQKFEYKNVKISDVMWCNFINSNLYREKLLEHKDEFWNKEEEKRIKLGFGTSFENRIAYKYLFD